MGHIDAIYKAGDDALANQFNIIFSAFSLLSIDADLKLRTTNVSIPEFSVGTYEVDYKTQKMEKPNGKNTTPNEWSFTFRADKYWVLYQALMAWKQFIANDDTGAMAEDVGAIGGDSGIRTDVIVIPTDSNDVPTSPGWTMEKSFLKSIAGIEFDTASGEPLTVAVTLSALKIVPNA